MASFVESATLLAETKSAQRNIKALNRELDKLFKPRKMSFATAGLKQAERDIDRVKRKADSLTRKVHTMRVRADTSQASKALDAIRAKAQRPVTMSAMASGVSQGLGRVNWRGYGSQIGFGFRASIGGEMWQAVHATGRTAGREIVASAGETTAQQTLGFTDTEILNLADSAERASRGMLQVSEVESRAAMRNLKTAGASDAALEGLTKTYLEQQSMLTSIFGKDEAARVMESALKGADLSGALDDVDLGSGVLKAFAAAQLRGGRDFNTKSFLASLRNTGKAQSLSAEALINLADRTDEAGQRAGTDLKRFLSTLTATGPGEGVAQAIIDGLQDTALKKEFERDRTAFERDPFEAIRRTMIPELERLNVNLDDATQVNAALQKLGFKDRRSRELMTSEITKRREREQSRVAARRLRYEKFRAAAEKDIGLALKAVQTQFRDTVDEFAQPLARMLAPAITDIAAGLDDLGRGVISAKSINALLKGGLIAGGGFAIANADKIALGTAALALRRSATNLTGAAQALRQAAATQQRWGRNGAPPVGGGRRGRGLGGRVGTGLGFGLALEGGSLAADWLGAPEQVGVALGDAASGAFLGGLVGGLPGAFAGAAISALTNSDTRAAIGAAVNNAVANDPMLSGVTSFLHDVVAADKEAARRREAAKIEEPVKAIAAVVAEVERRRQNQKANDSRAYFGEYPDQSDKVPIPVMRPDKVNLTTSAVDVIGPKMRDESDIRFMMDAIKLERQQDALKRQDSLMRTKDEAMTPPVAQALTTFETSVQASATQFQTAFGTGAQQVAQAGTTAGVTVGTAFSSGGTSAAAAIQSALAVGGAQAAAAIQAAAANIRVSVSNSMPNGPAPANAGATGGAL